MPKTRSRTRAGWRSRRMRRFPGSWQARKRQQALNCPVAGVNRPWPRRRPSQTLPATALVAEGEAFRVDKFGQDLKRFRDARAGAVEILIAVGDEDPARADGAQP